MFCSASESSYLSQKYQIPEVTPRPVKMLSGFQVAAGVAFVAAAAIITASLFRASLFQERLFFASVIATSLMGAALIMFAIKKPTIPNSKDGALDRLFYRVERFSSAKTEHLLKKTACVVGVLFVLIAVGATLTYYVKPLSTYVIPSQIALSAALSCEAALSFFLAYRICQKGRAMANEQLAQACAQACETQLPQSYKELQDYENEVIAQLEAKQKLGTLTRQKFDDKVKIINRWFAIERQKLEDFKDDLKAFQKKEGQKVTDLENLLRNVRSESYSQEKIEITKAFRELTKKHAVKLSFQMYETMLERCIDIEMGMQDAFANSQYFTEEQVRTAKEVREKRYGQLQHFYTTLLLSQTSKPDPGVEANLNDIGNALANKNIEKEQLVNIDKALRSIGNTFIQQAHTLIQMYTQHRAQ